MTKDKIGDGYFVDVETLAEKLEVADIDKAIEIAAKAKAVLKIGKTVRYDWRKAADWKAHNDLVKKEDISWLKAGIGSGYTHTADVTITETSESNKRRMRVYVRRDRIDKKFTERVRMLIGVLDNRLYITFNPADQVENGGMLIEKNQTGLAALFTIPDDFEIDKKLMVGRYDIHQAAEDLWYVKLSEKKG